MYYRIVLYVSTESLSGASNRGRLNISKMKIQNGMLVTDAQIAAELMRATDGVKPHSDADFIAATIRHSTGRVITQLWVIFVIMPVVLGIVYAILK